LLREHGNASMGSWIFRFQRTFYINREPVTLSTVGGAAFGFNNVFASSAIYAFFDRGVGLRSGVFFDALQLGFDWGSFASD